MIKRVNLLVLQAVADKLPPRTKEIVEDAIREICEWRDAMRKINATRTRRALRAGGVTALSRRRLRPEAHGRGQ